MRTLKHASLVMVWAFTGVCLGADEVREFVDGSTVQDLFARVYLSPTQPYVGGDDEITYGFMTKTSLYTRIYLPKDEYFCRFQLVDEKGAEMPRSGTGRGFGRNFDRLEKFSIEVLKLRKRRGERAIAEFTVAKPDPIASGFLPSVRQLFRVQKPGKYTLHMEFQVFKLKDSRDTSSALRVRLPQVLVPVVID